MRLTPASRLRCSARLVVESRDSRCAPSRTGVLDQKMNVIGRDHVVEHAKPEAFLRLEEPRQIALAIPYEREEKFSLMAVVSDA